MECGVERRGGLALAGGVADRPLREPVAIRVGADLERATAVAALLLLDAVLGVPEGALDDGEPVEAGEGGPGEPGDPQVASEVRVSREVKSAFGASPWKRLSANAVA